MIFKSSAARWSFLVVVAWASCVMVHALQPLIPVPITAPCDAECVHCTARVTSLAVDQLNGWLYHGTYCGGVHGIAVASVAAPSTTRPIAGHFGDPTDSRKRMCVPPEIVGASDASGPEPWRPEGGRTTVLSTRPTLHVVGTGQLLVGQAMPASNIQWIKSVEPDMFSLPDPAFDVRRVAGTHCRYAQTAEDEYFARGPAGADVELHALTLPPPSSVVYRGPTDELFIGFSHTIAVVKDGVVERYFGAPRALSLLPNETRAPGYVEPEAPQPTLDPVDRLAAVSDSLGGLTLAEGAALSASSGVLVVPEGGRLGQLRTIDLQTGVVRTVVGAGPHPRWPPRHPCLETDPLGCNGRNFSFFDLGGCVAPTAGSDIFCFSKMFPAVYTINLQTSRVRLVAGVDPFGFVVSAPEELAALAAQRPFNALRDITYYGQKLYVSSTGKGVFSVDVSDIVPAGNSSPPAQFGCEIRIHCNGRATSASGLPATGCVCSCTDDWLGDRCDDGSARREEVLPAVTIATATASVGLAVLLCVVLIAIVGYKMSRKEQPHEIDAARLGELPGAEPEVPEGSDGFMDELSNDDGFSPGGSVDEFDPLGDEDDGIELAPISPTNARSPVAAAAAGATAARLTSPKGRLACLVRSPTFTGEPARPGGSTPSLPNSSFAVKFDDDTLPPSSTDLTSNANLLTPKAAGSPAVVFQNELTGSFAGDLHMEEP